MQATPPISFLGFSDLAQRSKGVMDFDHKKLESRDGGGKYPGGASTEENQINDLKRCCADCRTTKTPLWRGGPAGPKSLCNACGIRYRKKRRALLGLKTREEKEKKVRRNHKVGVSFNLGQLGSGRDVSLESFLLQKDWKLAEEEEAAILLMALSSGFASLINS